MFSIGSKRGDDTAASKPPPPVPVAADSAAAGAITPAAAPASAAIPLPSGNARAEQASFANAPIRTTIPDEIVRHEISDEELSMLSDGSKSFARDAFLMALGAAIGTIPGFAKAWDEVFAAEVREPMTLERLSSLVLPLMLFAVVIVLALVLFFGRKGGVNGLVARIRARTQSRKL